MLARARLAAVTAALTLAPAALAKPWTPPPAAEIEPSPRPRTFDAPAERPRTARPPEPAVQFVLNAGFDLGSTKLITAVMSDGSTPSIKANQGLNAGLGLSFLKLAGGLFATQATIGIEGWNISASNGSVDWRAYPLELMELVYLDPVRLGAGLSYLLSPALSGDGFFALYDVEFENSPGVVLQADWITRLPQSARAGRFTFGVRYVIQKLEPKGGAGSIDANSFGFLVGYTG